MPQVAELSDGGALGEAEPGVRVQRLAGGGHAGSARACRVKFATDPLRIEFVVLSLRLRRSRPAWRPAGCGFGGCLLVLLQGFGDRIDLRRLLLLLGLRLFLRLLLGDRLRRIGLLLDRLFLDLRLRRRRGLGLRRAASRSILPTASSTGFASATLSTSGFGFSFLPDFMPAVTLASWSAEMMSTGSDSCGINSNALVENDTRPHPITRTCRATEATSVLSTFTFTRSGPLLHLGDQRQALEAGAGQLPHHPGHGAVIGLLVRPHIYTLFHAAAGVRNRL